MVDSEIGLILTNRHGRFHYKLSLFKYLRESVIIVVCSGPFIGEAIFHDHEEVPVIPVYRDPVSAYTEVNNIIGDIF